MDFVLNDDQKAIQEAARDFANSGLLPGVVQRDKEEHFPRSLITKMGEQGFLGMKVHPDYGGSGIDNLSYVVALEEISKVDASAGVIMSVNNSLVCYPLEVFGSEALKSKYLPELSSGQKLGAFCLSEPEAGSDASAIRTTAEKKGDYYLINGNKNWITNGNSAGIYLVFAQSDPSKGVKGISLYLMERETEGFTVGPKEDKMGIRASDTHSLNFTDVHIPEEQRVGDEEQGFKMALSVLDGGRIGIAAQALGIAAGAYERALAYSKERQTFGKPISQHQEIQFKLADMATKVNAARNMVRKAAFLKDQGEHISKQSAMAKLYASRVAMEVTNEAVQIHGGYGYVREYHVERMMRDAKTTQIYEGTSEIQKIVVSREILK